MNKVAKFEKVSFEQFLKSIEGTFLGITYDPENEEDRNKLCEIYDNIKLPVRATSGSAGYDFFSPIDFSLGTHAPILIPTGIRCRIDEGWVLTMYPRSGLGFKYRIQLDNTVGVIDSDYYNSSNEGHIMVKISCDSHSKNERVEIKKGQGIVQGILLPYGITEDDECDSIRDGGFGSTDGN